MGGAARLSLGVGSRKFGLRNRPAPAAAGRSRSLGPLSRRQIGGRPYRAPALSRRVSVGGLGRSLRYLFYHRPAARIMYHKLGVGRSFRDEHTRRIRVIMDRGDVREGEIEMPHIG